MPSRSRATVLGALSAAVVGAATLPIGAASAHAPAEGQVFVNEIHYDTVSTDTGEALEVAAPAGTDLTGWSLVLYNGNGGAAYGTLPLSGTVDDERSGFGAVSVPAPGLQNGSPDGVALVDAAGEVVQLLSYEGTFTAVGGPADGLTSTAITASESGAPVGTSLQLTGTALSYGGFSWTSGQSSFGSLNEGEVFAEGEPEPAPCDVAVTHEIGEVQGDWWRTDLRGQQVVVEGVVVGDFQGPGELEGFYLQDADGDGDPATSDGIFVHAPGQADVAEGDVVRVGGTADEAFGQTQVGQVSSLGTCGASAVPSTTLDLPAGDAARERVEGMLVGLDEPLTATESYDLGQYGEVTLSSGGRLYQPTNDAGDDAAEQELNALRSLLVDDGSNVQNPDDLPFTDVAGEVIRLGDTVTGLTGVLGYGFGDYRLQPTTEPTVTRTNPRTASPDDVGGDLDVASLNVLNYFTTLDRDGNRTDTGAEPRGANSATELQRQQAKIVEAIVGLDADVVGLMEIENDADDQAVDTLVAAINAETDRDYVAVEEPDTGGGLFGTDAIKVAMIYRPSAVQPVDRSYTTADDAFDNARLPLAQRFRPADGGTPFTVVVNHFKSKGCGGATGPDADQGDGQSCWNATRVAQSQALLDLMGGLDGDDFLVIGDLNSYGEEDPIDVLTDAGYVDTVDRNLPEAEQYSYVYFGQAGYLDHALASPHLAQRVTGTDIWHINSDEARILDYNTEYNPARFYEADPYRASDHDPVLVGLESLTGKARGKRR